MKNPQTTIALTFLSHIISGIGGVLWYLVFLGKTFVLQFGDTVHMTCIEV